MAQKKAPSDTESGVEVHTSTNRAARRYEDGVTVRTPVVPAQTAGPNDGRSAGTKKEKD